MPYFLNLLCFHIILSHQSTNVIFIIETSTLLFIYLHEFCLFSDRMEESISKSPIQLSSNSSSYAQYLESLPNNKTKEYDRVAQIVLKASKYLLNNNCKKYVVIGHIFICCCSCKYFV